MHWFGASSISIALLSLAVTCHGVSLPRRSDHRQSFTLRGSEHTISSAQSAYTAHPLIPRISDLTLIRFDPRYNISPIGMAAHVLAHFYSQISLGAKGPWANHQPRTWIRITYGSLQLLISATQGHTVPWNFVSWHALELLRQVQRGYVDTYDAYYMTPGGDAGVVVSLTCRGLGALTSAAAVLAAAANGDGSGPLDPGAKPFIPP